jgi:hypothetical protein
MSYLTARRILQVCTLATISSSLYAVDGVVLIDQSHALAGNITPGDTPGFPVTISQPGSYRLTGNLTVPDANTTAIQITADGVTIDMNGFSIIGPVVCTSSPAVCPPATKGIGIEADTPSGLGSPRGIRVFNGAVRGMGANGILITGAGSLIEKVTADGNAGGGLLAAGSVIESTATRNGGFGIFATIVRDCYSTDNSGVGIQLDAMGSVATGNVSSFNGSHGISAPNANLIGNMLVRNSGFGISATCPSSIVGNSIIGNQLGIITSTLEGCVLANNSTRQ